MESDGEQPNEGESSRSTDAEAAAYRRWVFKLAFYTFLFVIAVFLVGPQLNLAGFFAVLAMSIAKFPPWFWAEIAGPKPSMWFGDHSIFDLAFLTGGALASLVTLWFVGQRVIIAERQKRLDTFRTANELYASEHLASQSAGLSQMLKLARLDAPEYFETVADTLTHGLRHHGTDEYMAYVTARSEKEHFERHLKRSNVIVNDTLAALSSLPKSVGKDWNDWGMHTNSEGQHVVPVFVMGHCRMQGAVLADLEIHGLMEQAWFVDTTFRNLKLLVGVIDSIRFENCIFDHCEIIAADERHVPIGNSEAISGIEITGRSVFTDLSVNGASVTEIGLI